MTNRILISFVLVIFTSCVFAQSIKLTVNLGYGTYNLDEIKEIQNSINPIEGVEPVTEFPNHLFYLCEVDLDYEVRRIGLGYEYMFTGARNHYEDYSGEYLNDMLLNALKFSIKYQHKFSFSDDLPVSVFLGLKTGLIFSEFQVDEQLSLGVENLYHEEVSLKKNAPFIEPLLNVNYLIWKGLMLDFKIGYEFDIDYEFEKLYKDETYVLNRQVDWSGLRLSLGIAYLFDLSNGF